MFPNTVVFHNAQEIVEVNQVNAMRRDFIIFDEIDLADMKYNSLSVERLYVIDQHLTQSLKDFVISTIVNSGNNFQTNMMALKDLGIQYVVITKGGHAFYESHKISSSRDKRVGEPRSILAIEVGEQYTIRQLLSSAIDNNMREGHTFLEAIGKLKEAGIFGEHNLVVHTIGG